MANKKQTNKIVVELAKLLILNKARIATAESCTGGLISAFCTDLAGSSKWFYGTVVSYDNQAKVDIDRNETFIEGGTLTITPKVAINPSGNDSYQWFKDGIIIEMLFK
jgi:hypothetical protein